jgi:hypothetical protein
MYQGARTVYCRYPDTKGVELIYDLGEHPLLFLDLGMIFPGLVVWEDRGTAIPHPLHAGPDFYRERRLAKEDVVGRHFRSPYGIRLSAEPARPGPSVQLDNIQSHLMGGSLLRDGNTFRLWYTTREPKGVISQATQATSSTSGYDLGHLGNVLCYAESPDGVNWHKIERDQFFEAGKPTNIVYGSVCEPEIGFGGGSVFVDPSAAPNERYKMLFTGRMSPRRQLELAHQLGKRPDPMSLMTGIPPGVTASQDPAYAQGLALLAKGYLPDDSCILPDEGGQLLFGAISADGFHWQRLPQPIMWFMSEFNNAFYDVERQAYVSYIRLWHVGQRRTIGKAETKDFANWPFPKPILMPGLDEPFTTDYYTNAHSLYPGTTNIHLFFVAKYRRGTDDCSDIHLAISLDGDLFQWVPGGPVIAQEPWSWGPDADPGAGFIIPLTKLVQFDQHQVGLIYGGSNVAHKWPRTAQLQHFSRWALWENERIVALEAPAQGEFVTAGLLLQGRVIVVNAKTKMTGSLRAELLDERGEPVVGFSHENADPLVGDQPRAMLTWHGNGDLSAHQGRKVYLRFYLEQAKLYSISAPEIHH